MDSSDEDPSRLDGIETRLAGFTTTSSTGPTKTPPAWVSTQGGRAKTRIISIG